MMVLGVDPGVHTGVAWFDDAYMERGLDAPTAGFDVFNSGLLKNARQFALIVETVKPDCIAMEDFLIPHKTVTRNHDLISPVKVAAMCQVWLEVLEWSGVYVWQSSSYAKTAYDDVHLKRAGFWVVGKGAQHARDAFRHALAVYDKAADGKL